MPEWTDLHRAIIGDFLGRISAESYKRGQFLASALVVSKATGEPGYGFRAFVKDLELCTSSRNEDFIAFWSDQVNKAHEWYALHDL